jgi:hypothetical protein
MKTASQLIDGRIEELGDWRGDLLGRLRALIRLADPDVVEEWKWMGTPVWSHDGLLCTGETYKSVVKMTFPKGASLPDPSRLFNSSLEGNARRAIDFHEGDAVNEPALKALIREAIALNMTKPAKRKPDATSTVTGYLPGTKKAKAKPAKTKPAAKKKRAANKKAAAKKK